MATEPTAPSRPAQKQYGPGVFLTTILPLLLLATLLGGLGVMAVYAYNWYQTHVSESKDLVWGRIDEPITLTARPLDWAFMLAGVALLGLVVLAVALFGLWLLLRSSGSKYAPATLRGAVTAAIFSLIPFGYLIIYHALPTVTGAKELDGRLWLALLIPVLLVGLFYIVWMYVRDAVSIGWPWAFFLGFLRATVYGLLALVFLLPRMQTWDESKTESKVVMFLDVSPSLVMVSDDMPGQGVPLTQLLKRQDKVLKLLGDEQIAFLKKLEEKNPVTVYRFGRYLDENYKVFDKEGRAYTRPQWEERQRKLEDKTADEQAAEPKFWLADDWTRWLKPSLDTSIPEGLAESEREQRVKEIEFNQRMFSATNLGDSLLTGFGREVNNMVQGIIIITDGRSTEGTPNALKELSERAGKAQIPLFVVGVGENREKIKIEFTDLRLPEHIRPEDRFRATVDVTGEGLTDKEVDISLDVIRYDRKSGQPDGEIVLVETKPNGEPTGTEVSLGQKVTIKPEGKPKFRASSPPLAQAEFPLDAATVAKWAGKEIPEGKKVEFKDDKEGELRFIARVPKDPREDFDKDEHRSDPAAVTVLKRPLRVLLFASGPLRDYQFVRTLLVREMDKGRAEVSIYLQPVPGQDQPRQGRVQDVPPERLLTRFPDLMQDESRDTPETKFYNLSNYDVILAFDPDWTKLTDQQLQMIEKWVGAHGGGLVAIGGPVNTLQLARPGAQAGRLKPILDIYPVVLQDSRIQELDRPTTDPFPLRFVGANAEMEFVKLDEEHPNGSPLQAWDDFFNGRIKGSDKPGTPKGFYNYYPVERKKDGATTVATFTDPRAKLPDGQEQPYLVTMPYGSGKTVWLGSAETWRLRQYREAYHERFWTKLSRFSGSGNLTRLNRRVIPNLGRVFTANNYVNVEAQIYDRDMKPMAQNARPKVLLRLPGGVVDKEMAKGFEMTPKPSQGEWTGWFSTRFLVKAPGEYGLEIRVTETGDSESRKFMVKESNPELDNTRPDFTALRELASPADAVLSRVSDDTRNQLKTRLSRKTTTVSDKPDTKDKTAPEERLRLYFDLNSAELIPNCMITDSRTHRNRGATSDLWDGGFTIWPAEPQPIKMSYILAAVVGLLSIEWLCRKLLRLA